MTAAPSAAANRSAILATTITESTPACECLLKVRKRNAPCRTTRTLPRSLRFPPRFQNPKLRHHFLLTPFSSIRRTSAQVVLFAATATWPRECFERLTQTSAEGHLSNRKRQPSWLCGCKLPLPSGPRRSHG